MKWRFWEKEPKAEQFMALINCAVYEQAIELSERADLRAYIV